MSDPILVPPTPERIAKGDVGTLETKRGGRETRSFKHPLDYYLKCDRITQEERDAGTRYGELYEIGYMRSMCAQSKYGDPMLRGNYDPHFADHCRTEYNQASLVLRDMTTRMMVFDVCIHGKMAGRGRVDELQSALRALHKHFYRNGVIR